MKYIINENFEGDFNPSTKYLKIKVIMNIKTS